MKPEYQAVIQQAYREFLQGRDVKPRGGQKQMIADIAKSFAAIEEDDEGRRQGNNHLLAIEAGTGTGKTLAYLLATLPLAQARKKRLVISTATVALQEQLLYRDLPDLKKLTSLDFNFALAKGRGRYLCTSQLAKVAASLRETAQEDDNPTLNLFEKELLSNTPVARDEELLTQLLDDFASGRWSGDRDSLEEKLPQELWDRLTTDHQRCSNRRCPHFAAACPFYNARRELEQADVIVANHDLVLADLALGGGVILPAPEQSYYVFDEAHHLPDKAINHFAASFRFNTSLKWLNLLKKSQKDLLQALVASPAATRSLNQLFVPLEDLIRDLGSLYTQLRDQTSFQEGYNRSAPVHRWPQGQLPEGMKAFAEQLQTYFASLSRHLESLVNQLREAQDPEKNTSLDSDIAAEWQPLLALLHGRALAAHQLWSLCALEDEEGRPPLARWLLLHRLNEGDEDLELAASPVTAAGDLAYRLWSRCFGSTLTSATLTALGRFDRLKQRAGLAEATPCKAYPSPFDYPRLGVLEVPSAACDPSQQETHTQAILDYIETELNHPQAAALVLFSSRRQMNEVFDTLAAPLKRVTLTQDHLSKKRLIEKHRERIDGKKPSILFGLASLAEGIDLPGRYLTHVVIVRLPFSTPDDPVEATLAEWIESTGGNPFMQITVPDASIRLVQACGRLIRKEDDEGRITLLDRRILTKRYGSQLLNSLPPFTRQLSR
ncbi:ATP-dependent DNA helicase DinG [Marinospirillum perlucidum]|uniref:ATP-dependent DNA helicase DinG n=1 Tax=Marinospirillum perlucidum TaxID=1982602 RepID=UPI000DF12484|nr:ATP-dependent DNA helicase DinG [Marinospirillum perlucidum]